MTTNGSQGSPKRETGLVAVIGLGCIFPDANSPAEFWENIRNGKSSIREVPHDRWDPALYYSPDPAAPEKTYSKIGAFVTNFKFDAMRYRIPPSVVKMLDDTQLWGIAAAAQALADAGLDTKPFDRSRCSVILGNAMGGEIRSSTGLRVFFPEFRRALEETPSFKALGATAGKRLSDESETAFKSHLPEITEDTMPGELSNVIAGRIANTLNLTGKNFTTDAACASSIAAMDAAVKSLVSHECDLVLTGGIDKSMDAATYVKFSKIGALSAEGSFPFDARAGGFVMGEGAGIVLLKRLEDAERDGDRIYAVIRGVGSSSDGKGKGITAPNIDGQISCVTRAFHDAEISPDTIDLMECHGTSTKVGDVVEIQALTRIFGPVVPKKQSIPVGSVKSNFGHTKSAAGAASLIKVILGMQHQTLPPSINFKTPNPNLHLETTPFYVIAQPKPWPEPTDGRPRRAAISSFGFGGTNFNLVVESYVPGRNVPKARFAAATAAPIPSASPSPLASVLLNSTPKHRTLEPLAADGHTDLLVIGADSREELGAEAQRVLGLFKTQVSIDSFHTFLRGQGAPAMSKRVRVAAVVASPQDAAEKIASALEAMKDPRKLPLLAVKGIHVGEGPAPGKVAFLFPGQGSQYADMTRDLATRFESVKRTIEEADRVMEPLVGKPLSTFLFSDESRGHRREQVEEQLKRTEITQPSVLGVDIALFRVLQDYGVRPDMVAGHSLGEYGALVAAGVLTFEDAIHAVSARGREMASVNVPDLGKMASVTADTATVEAKLKQVQGYVIPANKNCKIQTVIAGSSASVDAAVQMFNAQGITAQLIPVSAAFHSAIVAPASEPMRRVIQKLDLREPKTPVLSNVHADYYPKGTNARDQIIDLLARQVAAPVEWQKQIERLYADGVRLFVEVGPKSALTTFVRNILEGRPHGAVATNHPKKGGFFHLFDALAFLAANGYPVRLPDPTDAGTYLSTFRDTVRGAAAPTAASPALVNVPAGLTQAADQFIRQKQEELRVALLAQLGAVPVSPPAVSTASDPELVALKKRVDELGLNLEPVLITGVSVGTPGLRKRLFDDRNFDRIFLGENAIDVLSQAEQQMQVDKNIVRLVKSETGDHRFESITDVAEVIKLAAKKGEFSLDKEYGLAADLVAALDITSQMAIAAGIEALHDAQIPLVRGYVKTTTGKFLPGEWALPEPLQAETGIIFASAFPGMSNLVDQVSRYLSYRYGNKPYRDIQELYDELIRTVQDPQSRETLQTWYARHQSEIRHATQSGVFEFSRRFLVQVLSMGHSQLAQLIRAKGPNTQVNAACSSTTQGIALAEDWIRMGRCKRVLVVGADDVTNETMIDTWAAGFLAAGAATTKGDVREAALPFDRRRHGMIIGSGAVGLVVEAESVVKGRGMEAIAELVATHTSNSAYHITRLDTEDIAQVMDRLVATAEKRTGLPRGEIAQRLLFMSHETYTPARGGSAAAEIAALTKAFGPDASKVVVANTKGFTGHPMGASIEDAIAIRSVQTGRVPPIANLREPDPGLGNIRLSQGGSYDLQYGLRLAAGFGSQVAMYLFKLRSKDMKRIVDSARYQAWVSRVSGTKDAELEVVHRTLRVKAQLPALTEAPRAAPPTAAPPVAPAPVPAVPKPRVPVPAVAAPNRAAVLDRIIGFVADKTGYTKEMLEPDLDLEADLGIDTVKQAELFGLIRESYQLPQEEGLQLKDYPTLNKMTGYILSRLGGGAAATVAASAPAPLAAAPAAPIASRTASQVLDRLTSLVAEKTGYGRELLEPDLELEADLGIDTVKQAEIFGMVREEFQIPRDDTIQLRDYPTLRKMAGYLHSMLGGPVAAVSAPPEARPAPAPSAERAAPTLALPTHDVLERIRVLVAEKTGYPLEMLDPELDLEADLGIDTVKQAEMFGLIRESYGITRRDDLQLKDYNTLAKLALFVTESASGAAAVAPGATLTETSAPAPAPTPAPALRSQPTATPATAAASTADVLARVRQLVAEKTGYPLELLDPDLDLEADLGIDTVKQAEMFGILRETYGIPRRDDIQLKDFNTLTKLAAFLVAPATTLEATAPTAALEAATRVDETPAPPPGSRVSKRYLVRYASLPSDEPDASTLRGKTILVWAPTNMRADLQHALRAAGATSVAIDALPTRLEEAQGWLDQQRRKTPRISGLLFVPTPNPAGSEFTVEDTNAPKALFYLVKSLLSGAKSGEVDVLGVATFLGGDFAAQPQGPLNPLEGSLIGFAKAFAREIPSAVVKAVDFAQRTPAPALAQAFVEELGRRDGIVEVGTLGGRGTLKLLAQDTAEEEPGIELQDRDVIVVSGGATGITSDVVRRLAGIAPAGFVLLGRTPLHADAARYAAFTEQEWAGKRVEVQADLKARGEKATPVAVERVVGALRKAAEIHATLDALQRAGARAEYHAIDVTDEAALSRLLRVVRSTLGPVTGLIHAAGVEESKLIVDKTSESFSRVYDPKVLGARALLAATREDPVRFFLAFTSIAGRFGNAGQADYSAANDSLAKLCAALRAERGRAFAATAMDWTAWAEKGMATRGSVMSVLREAGVAPLPLREGVERVLQELQHGCQDAEVLIAGELGRFAPVNAFTGPGDVLPVRSIQAAPRETSEVSAPGQQSLVLEEAPASRGNLVQSDVSSDGRTATATLVLDPGEHFLRDHRIDGVPYLPGVFGQEAFAEVAAHLAPGYAYVGARDLEFRLPAKVLRDRPLEVSIIASIAHESDERIEVGCRLQSLFVNAKGERMGAPRIHFTGTLLFDKQPPTPPAGPGSGGDLAGIVEKKGIYQSFFHGPSFQVLDRVGFTEEGHTAIGLWSDPRAPLFSDRKPSFLTNPMMRELAYQTAGAFELFRHHYLSLPKAEGRLKFYRNAPPSQAARAFAHFKALRGDTAHFDIVVATPEDEVLFEIEDFQLIRLRPLESGNGGATATPEAPPLYRSRWGHDVPLPLAGVVGVQVDQGELARMNVRAEEALTSGERVDQERYRNEKRAREFFAGRLAAKEAIAQLLGRPLREARGIEVRRLETGEPQARGSGLEAVRVSITHTGATALAVATKRDAKVHTLGIDAELIEPKADAFEREAFADSERSLIDGHVSEGTLRPELLVRLWAVKEAVLKALGKGFALALHDVQVHILHPDGRAEVTLKEPAQKVLREIGGSEVQVQTWTAGTIAYAMAWTRA